MATIVEVGIQHFEAGSIFLHIGRQQQLLDLLTVCGRCEHLVETLLIVHLFEGGSSRETVEVVKDETQFTIAVGRQVGRTGASLHNAFRLEVRV